MITKKLDWRNKLKKLLEVEITDENLRLRLFAVIELLIEKILEGRAEEVIKLINK